MEKMTELKNLDSLKEMMNPGNLPKMLNMFIENG
jgi:hypothetical protein